MALYDLLHIPTQARLGRIRGHGIRRGLTLVCLLLMLMVNISCSKDEPNDPQTEQNHQTVLVYMVAANSLSGNVFPDLYEMKNALRGMDMSKKHLLVFISSVDDTQTLYRLEPDDTPTGYTLHPIKKYDTSLTAVDPARMSQVIADTRQAYPAQDYGLILWSHATGWTPSNRAPAQRSFGDDFGHKMNIDKLAEAIPDNLFTFIWMDCCYMSNIECIYQLRNDCRYYIGYPTEVLADGMNYSATLPYLMAEDGPDVASAAEAMFNDYQLNSNPCTIAVVDMQHIEDVATHVRSLYEDFSYPDPYGVQVYSRGIQGPFYDLMQYATRAAGGKDISPLQQAMDRAVIYKSASPTFMGLAINLQSYSGISTHAYRDADTPEERYYRTLDWYRAVLE